MRQPRYYVYSHSLDGVVFYIGKGSAIRANSRHGRNELWYGIVKGRAFQVGIIKIFKCSSAASDFERSLIRRVRPFANICDNPDNARLLWNKIHAYRINLRDQEWRSNIKPKRKRA